MTELKSPKFSFDSMDLLVFFYKNKMLILLVTLIGAISSIIVSFIITPKFESSVVLFPASSSSVSKELLTDISLSSKNIMKFGEEEEAEQLLQVLYSDQIKSKIMKKYDLMNHYKIDKNSRYPLTRLNKEWDNNISYRKTEYQSIQIKVLDAEPQTAANIANDIGTLLDTVMNEILRQRAGKALEIVEKEYKTAEKNIKLLEDSISLIEYGGSSNNSGILPRSNIKSTVKNILTGRNNLVQANLSSLQSLIQYETQRLALLKAKLAEARVDAEQNLPHKFVVNQAQVAEAKSYPIRWLIVTISTISTFLFSLFISIFLEYLKELKLRLKENK